MASKDDYLNYYKERCEAEEKYKSLILKIKEATELLESDPDHFAIKGAITQGNRGYNYTAISAEEWSSSTIMHILNYRFNLKENLKGQYSQLSPTDRSHVSPPF